MTFAFLTYVYMCEPLWVYVHQMHACTPETSTEVIISHHVSDGNQTRAFCKTRKSFKVLSHPYSLLDFVQTQITL